jgi:hypothetical protein
LADCAHTPEEEQRLEELAEVLTVILARRYPELKEPADIPVDEIDALKDVALEFFVALIALGYRLVRLPTMSPFDYSKIENYLEENTNG